ncbi:MAG: hypothetical protein KAU83_01595, partial [Bacteroidales bacterium]|nr:hypothetical protein [Bacteroidales bacterium]
FNLQRFYNAIHAYVHALDFEQILFEGLSKFILMTTTVSFSLTFYLLYNLIIFYFMPNIVVKFGGSNTGNKLLRSVTGSKLFYCKP